MINKNRLIKTFIDLVKIDSPSGEEDRIAKEVSTRLKKLGVSIEHDSYGNVIGKLPGTGEPILLNCHLDTVEPGRDIKPAVNKDVIASDGTTILGGDPKAGLAAILEAITSINEDGRKNLPIEIVLTRQEEIGLLGARNLDFAKISAKQGITFDGEDGIQNITISAPGYNKIDVTILGKGAHAGAEPEKGISSIKIASHIISELKVGRIDEETTANIGIIEGGTARNAVPFRTHFKGEIRSRDLKKLDRHTRHFEKTIQKALLLNPNAKIEIDLKKEFDPYEFCEDQPIIERVKQTLKSMSLTPNICHSGGATDVNIFHTHGIGAVVVGSGFYNAHTTEEFVKISDLLKTAEFAEKIVMG